MSAEKVEKWLQRGELSLESGKGGGNGEGIGLEQRDEVREDFLGSLEPEGFGHLIQCPSALNSRAASDRAELSVQLRDSFDPSVVDISIGNGANELG